MTSTPAVPHVVVIGAGIGGLTAAYTLQVELPRVAVTVLEGSPQIGGKLRLGEVAGQQVDLGAESILNRRPEATALARAVGLGHDLVFPATTSAAVWTRGDLHPLPPTLMGIPADLAKAARSGILSRTAVARATLERRMADVDLTDDIGVGRLVTRRLGRDIRDRLVEPLLGGVYAGRSDEISVHAAVPQLVAAVKKYGGLLPAAAGVTAEAERTSAATGAATPVFAGIAGGVGRLAIEVGRDVEHRGGVIRRNATVRELEQTSMGWQLVVGPTAAPEAIQADAVVVATPAVAAARLLRGVAPAAALDLGRIEYASMALVTLAFRAADVGVELLQGSGFLVPPVDRRVVKATTYTSRKWTWLADDAVIVRCSIGRHRDEAELQRDDSELVEAAVLDLREAVGLRAALVDARVTRWGGARPQYAVGHLDRVARIRAAVDAVPGLAICGAALDGLGIPAVISTAHAAATRVVDHLRAVETMAP